MTHNKFWTAVSKALTAVTMTLIVTLVFATSASASMFKILYQFTKIEDGELPSGTLIMDASGNLYGTTSEGGSLTSNGTVFKLTPTAGGDWTFTVLYTFSDTPTEGGVPYGGVIFDATGNLYGTTGAGGIYSGGTVFELSPTASGDWKEKILHNFGSGEDGFGPFAGLIFDASGNLYGTTGNGGAYDLGTVFKLSPTASGGWKEEVLHAFNNNDGSFPSAGLIFDASGNLYGTTVAGGPDVTGCSRGTGCGVVFKLMPHPDGTWTESVLHSFEGTATDGAFPYAGLILDAAGNLYGTTYQGGANDYGTIFELSPTASGGWKEKILRNGSAENGIEPLAGLIFDASGNLYGTASEGGLSDGMDDNGGVVFKLTPTASGFWSETVLYAFTSYERNPVAVIMDAAGNLFGTAANGALNYGSVFEILKKCPE